MCVGGPGQLEFQSGRVVTQRCSFIATPLLRRHTQQNPPFGPTAQNLFARGALSSLCHGVPANLPGLGTETGTENTETTRIRNDRTGDNRGLGLFQDCRCLLLHGVPHFVEEQHGVVQRGQTQGFYPLAELGLVLLELHQRRRVRSNDEALFKQF